MTRARTTCRGGGARRLRKAGGVPLLLLFGGIGGVAAILLAVGFAVYWFGLRDRASDGPAPPGGSDGPQAACRCGARQGPVDPPEGWKEFASERDGFKAYFAGDPETGSTNRVEPPHRRRGPAHYRDYSYRSQASWADLAPHRAGVRASRNQHPATAAGVRGPRLHRPPRPTQGKPSPTAARPRSAGWRGKRSSGRPG